MRLWVDMTNQPNTRGGIKYDSDKPMCGLLEPEWLLGTAKVLTMGAKKYAPNNWQKVERQRYVHALYRHWLEYQKGNKTDEESGLSHLYHMSCCIMFLDWFDRVEKADIINT